jgi:hypothetical protein
MSRLGMSIAVAIDDLPAAAADFGFAYVVTVGDDRRPHLVAATPSWTGGDGGTDGDDGAAGVTATIPVGRTTVRNVAGGSVVTLCFPPVEAGGFSLIVDGTAEASGADDPVLTFHPTGAVLHRPAG